MFSRRTIFQLYTCASSHIVYLADVEINPDAGKQLSCEYREQHGKELQQAFTPCLHVKQTEKHRHKYCAQIIRVESMRNRAKICRPKYLCRRYRRGRV